MPTPAWFFGFDSLMEFIAFTIAIAVAYQALKGYRLSKERTLLYLNLSFVLLGAGLLIEGLSNLVVVLARFHRGFLILAPIGYTINFITQVLAYGVLIFTYVQQTRKMGVEVAMAAVPLLLFERNAFTELILIFLLAYIAIQTLINYSINKTTTSLLVLGAFVSLVLSHMFFLLFTLAPLFFAFAHIAQLFGFLLLLAMLLRVNQPT
ncbi:MAG: hypothetical protein ABSF82_14035 [Candidatus Bathyarchaeia archaeon]